MSVNGFTDTTGEMDAPLASPAVLGRKSDRAAVEEAKEKLEGIDGVKQAGLTGTHEIPVAINRDTATVNDVRAAGLEIDTTRALGPSVIELNHQLNATKWDDLLADADHWVTGFVTGLE
jgi:hypothetical protein